jgi:hypothetical protein
MLNGKSKDSLDEVDKRISPLKGDVARAIIERKDNGWIIS